MKWILRYLQGAKDIFLTFTKSDNFNVEGFCDSDYSTDLDKKKVRYHRRLDFLNVVYSTKNLSIQERAVLT